MSKPAARLGDETAHGGKIVSSASQVFIEGPPAARNLDRTVCPVAPAGAPPHVGGPITATTAPMVLVEGQPIAARGDVATCAGDGPAAIVGGASQVLVGDE